MQKHELTHTDFTPYTKSIQNGPKINVNCNALELLGGNLSARPCVWL